MIRAWVPAVFLAILIPSHAVTPRQSSAPPAQARPPATDSSSPYTLRVDAEEVVLNCTVLDGKRELVKDLGKESFKVSEDKKPQTIVSLQRQDTPVSIGLLVDDSGSMKPKRAAVAAAALDFIKASNPDDETFVINFSDQAYLDQDFTSSLDRLRTGLDHRSLSGGTALYDTVVAAADKMEKSATRPRKVLIVITDGDDNSSKLALSDAIRRVEDMDGPTVYAIGLLFGGDKARHAKHDLQALASETGGIAFFPGSLEEIGNVVAEAARDIRNQYAISYHATHASDGNYHSVHVEARDRAHGKLVVYTRAGYRSK